MKVPQVSKKTLNLGGQLIELAPPLIMGILNLTPDSFYSGSRFEAGSNSYVDKAGQMLNDGARILDVGGYSTRPGAAEVTENEEIDRTQPVIENLKKTFPEATISIDTFRSGVARQAVRAGAGIINDVSGGNLDPAMFATVAELKVPYILMHMRGTPQTMTKLSNYTNPVRDVLKELVKKLLQLRSMGVLDVIVDPGFGFAKTVPHNFLILNLLQYFHELNAPILIGLSRKSMVWKSLGVTAEEALNGTTVLNTLAINKQVDILRVHDVKPAAEAVKLWELTVGKS